VPLITVAALGAVLAACSGDGGLAPDGSNASDLGVSSNKQQPAGSNSLQLTIGGLPTGTAAVVTVAGPNGYSANVAASATLSGLANGTYSVTASEIGTAAGTLAGSPATQSVSLRNGRTVRTAVTYTATATAPAPSPGLNLQIVGMYLSQSVQTLSGSVPLVTGRDGVLRVFAVASGSNNVRPTVRARFYQGGVLVATLTAPAGGASVSTALNEGATTASWNVPVPGTLVQPGLSVVADVDPEGAVAETSEEDNQFPLSGTPLPLPVRTLPGLALRFVPVVQSASGLTGDVNEGNTGSYLERLRDMFPVSTIATSVRAPYTTSRVLRSDGSGWGEVLSELNNLRLAEGRTEHYYGVVRTSYSSGVVGTGFLGWPVAIGWDATSNAASTLAHELGHNWDRSHAPCGNPDLVDTSFPHAGGTIGVVGWNVRTNTLLPRSAPDVMGYCGSSWISDYNYRAVLEFRATSTRGIITAPMVQSGLLVSGSVAGDGTLTLEPAVRVTAPSALPARAGSLSLEGTDAAGAPLFSLAFEPVDVADVVPGGAQHFAFVVPLEDAALSRLQTIRVRGAGRVAERTSRAVPAAIENAAEAAQLDAVGSARARIRWNAGDFPLAVVRRASTGEIVSFARGGDLQIDADDAELEVVLSDGVRSATRRVRVRGR
jgi:hypothetical protein